MCLSDCLDCLSLSLSLSSSVVFSYSLVSLSIFPFIPRVSGVTTRGSPTDDLSFSSLSEQILFSSTFRVPALSVPQFLRATASLFFSHKILWPLLLSFSPSPPCGDHTASSTLKRKNAMSRTVVERRTRRTNKTFEMSSPRLQFYVPCHHHPPRRRCICFLNGF